MDVLSHAKGLDPRFCDGGGFCGAGIYLAESPAYPIGGRYAHRVAGFGGGRVQLLLMRAACGTPQELGTRVDAETRAMRMPGQRPDGQAYDSVRAGPHRPFRAGTSSDDDGDATSIVHVLFESQQM